MFTPLFYSLLRYNDAFRWVAVIFECVAGPVTVFFLGSYLVQKIGRLSLRVFRLGFICTLIYGAISLAAFFFVIDAGGEHLIKWMGIVIFAGIPFQPIAALTGNFFFLLWGFVGALICFCFSYLLAGPLLYGALISLIHFGVGNTLRKLKEMFFHRKEKSVELF